MNSELITADALIAKGWEADFGDSLYMGTPDRHIAVTFYDNEFNVVASEDDTNIAFKKCLTLGQLDALVEMFAGDVPAGEVTA